jgi:Tfp pilus assembly protein PilV
VPLTVVWIAVAVLAVVVLGVLAYGVLGAAGRLRRELAALEQEVRPLLTEAQATAARAARTEHPA